MYSVQYDDNVRQNSSKYTRKHTATYTQGADTQSHHSTSSRKQSPIRRERSIALWAFPPVRELQRRNPMNPRCCTSTSLGNIVCSIGPFDYAVHTGIVSDVNYSVNIMKIWTLMELKNMTLAYISNTDWLPSDGLRVLCHYMFVDGRDLDLFLTTLQCTVRGTHWSGAIPCDIVHISEFVSPTCGSLHFYSSCYCFTVMFSRW